MTAKKGEFCFDMVKDENSSRDYEEVDLNCKECLRDRIIMDLTTVLKKVIENELTDMQKTMVSGVEFDGKRVKTVARENNYDYQTARRSYMKGIDIIQNYMKYVVEFNKI